MSDHLVLYVDRLVRPAAAEPVTQPAEVPSEPAPSSDAAGPSSSAPPVDDDARSEHDENEPLIQMAECRICQEEDSVKNLETPCACSGSLKVYLSILFSVLYEFQVHYRGFVFIRCIHVSELWGFKRDLFFILFFMFKLEMPWTFWLME